MPIRRGADDVLRSDSLLSAGMTLSLPVSMHQRVAGADRFSTSNCWRRNAISASRAACDRNNPARNPPSSFKSRREGNPSLDLRHPDEIFGRDKIYPTLETRLRRLRDVSPVRR
jgi:hypothetical protein